MELVKTFKVLNAPTVPTYVFARSIISIELASNMAIAYRRLEVKLDLSRMR